MTKKRRKKQSLKVKYYNFNMDWCNMELTQDEFLSLRKAMYDEVAKLPHLNATGWLPETKDFESVKTLVLSKIAYTIWEKEGRPKNNDVAIWLQAEETWNYLRYGWV